MKLRYYFGVLALGLMTSCVQEQFLAESVVPSAPDFEVVATLNDEPETRTQMSADGSKVLWCAGDAISVLNDGSLYRYVVKTGEGMETATFKFSPLTGDEITGATGEGISSDVFAAVYPHNPSATLVKSDNGYLINTEIPASQTYAVNSYGENSSPMVGVNDLRPYFRFKNVGSFLLMPIVSPEGENVTIMSASLESKNHKIAGATAVTMVDGVPTSVEVAADGQSVVSVSCGEGVKLDPVTPTNFIFVLAPGTYEAEDLVLTFTDNVGNYFKTTIAKENTFVRSQGLSFKTRTFDVTGVDAVDLWVKAIAEAYVEAERIVPTITSISKTYNWVKALATNPDVENLLQEAATLITLGKYELAYDLLNGIPGFERQYNHIEAVGSSIVKVSPDGLESFTSLLSDIEKITDAKSLIKFLNDYERMYEASGIKSQLNTTIGTIGDYIKDPSLILGLIKGDKTDQTTEEALVSYKETLKSKLNNQVTLCNAALEILKFTSSFAGEKEELSNFINAVNALLAKIDALETKEDVENEVKKLPKININITFEVPIFGTQTINRNIDPTTFLGEAEDVFNNLISDSIFNNGMFDGFVDAIIDDILDYNFVETLEASLNSDVTGNVTMDDILAALNLTDTEASKAARETIKNKLTKNTVEYLFSQPQFKQMVIDSLREIVKAYEDSEMSDIAANNKALRDQAIALAKSTAITKARVKATYKIDTELAADNEENLNSGAWGMFKKVLNNKKCVDIFTELSMLDVYNALTEFVAVVDGIYTFEIKPNEAGEKYNYYKEPADYEQDVDWWLLTFVSDSEEVDE